MGWLRESLGDPNFRASQGKAVTLSNDVMDRRECQTSSCGLFRRLRRFPIRLLIFDVALVVEMFDALPNSAFVDVGDYLASVEAGNEFHRLVALHTSCRTARLNCPDNSPALPHGGCIAHRTWIGRSGVPLD